MFKSIHRLFVNHALVAFVLIASGSATPAAAVVAFAPSVVKRAAVAPPPTSTDMTVQQQIELAIVAALVLGLGIVTPRARSNGQLRSVAA
ncbi:hypothetical protein [Sandarakinorhabdus sp.]|uniref:hypothetical protein n=1 Tax=Sandarakinorhabdus sp. TaxID=1916663 RepID=UPI00286E09A4|nr:hypothetical protein [Sandarakinorhabdus sp.]